MSFMKEQIRNKKSAAMETGVLVAMKWMIFMKKLSWINMFLFWFIFIMLKNNYKHKLLL